MPIDSSASTYGFICMLAVCSTFVKIKSLVGYVLPFFIIFLLSDKRYRWFYILYKTLPRDFIAISRFLIFNLRLRLWGRKNQTVAKIATQHAKLHPNKVAFCFENKEWTFSEVEDYTNKVANYFKSQGYKKGDSIALMMESKPELIFIWLGLSKLGVVTALIHASLRKASLAHSIAAAKSCALIFGSEVADGVDEVLDTLAGMPLYQFDETGKSVTVASANDLNKALKDQPTCEVPEAQASLPDDKLIYIYTSGTTGLPKAAVITNNRFLVLAAGVHFMQNISSDDVVYDPLPLFHSAGGVVGVGQSLLFGNTVVVRRKFSASSYWLDCINYKCTVGQYIGEMCRYMLASPERPEDKQHKVRLMMGNGLRPQIWRQFKERFHIARIGEFYGATEGNANLMNTDDTVGAVGFVPRYAWFLYPVTIIRFNEETGEPLRDENGFCMQCQPGVPGLVIGKISKRKVNSFTGYADQNATEKKVIKNLFYKGDLGFNTGDILVMDELGYYYFKDRTGDTFRWRGENVATSEVEDIISKSIGLKDIVVYGVEVPNVEGKAGMASIMDKDNSLNMEIFSGVVAKNLAPYARPLFVRIVPEMSKTGTYKLKKTDLQQQGFNPTVIKDKLYFFRNGAYEPLTQDLFNNIVSGKERL